MAFEDGNYKPVWAACASTQLLLQFKNNAKKTHSFAGISPYLLYKLQISPYVVFFFMRRREADVILNPVLFSKYVEYCS